MLLHGGELGGWCWERVLPLLSLPSIAVELRSANGAAPALVGMTLDDYVMNALRQLESAAFEEVVVVAHSLGGVTALRLSAQRPDLVRHLVFVSCAVPPAGRSVVSAFPQPWAGFAAWWYRRGLRTGHARPIPRWGARLMYCHGLSPADRRLVVSRRVAEPPRIVLDAVPGAQVPPDLPFTWIRLRRDRGLPPFVQDRMRANLNRPAAVVELDAPHMVMLAQPSLLAAALNRIVERPREPRYG